MATSHFLKTYRLIPAIHCGRQSAGTIPPFTNAFSCSKCWCAPRAHSFFMACLYGQQCQSGVCGSFGSRVVETQEPKVTSLKSGTPSRWPEPSVSFRR